MSLINYSKYRWICHVVAYWCTIRLITSTEYFITITYRAKSQVQRHLQSRLYRLIRVRLTDQGPGFARFNQKEMLKYTLEVPTEVLVTYIWLIRLLGQFKLITTEVLSFCPEAIKTAEKYFTKSDVIVKILFQLLGGMKIVIKITRMTEEVSFHASLAKSKIHVFEAW